MNKRQVIILWVIAVALGVAVTIVKLNQNESTRSATHRARGQTLFETLPVNNAAAIDIQGASDSVSLANKNGKWVVVNRGDYPANSTFVNDFLRTLADLKITLGMQAGPKLAPRFGMDEAATKPEDRGLTATIKDATGTEIAKVSLGKSIDSNASESPMGGGSVGRYVRNHADESGFYAVSEMFPSVSTEAKRWLADGFFNPEKVKSISVSQPGKSDAAWKLTRDGEDAEFKLDGATATEVVDTTATGPLKSIFSYARFDDVVPSDKVAERAVADQKRIATLETFEGFIYTVAITPTKPASTTPPVEGEAPSADSYLLTVDVAAELPTERKKEEGEKPEDSKTKDTAFADRLKALAEKLAKEKAFAGITFEVGKTTVDPLLKDRAGLIAKATPPAADAAKQPIQSFPGGMIAPPPGSAPSAPARATATTPPVSATTPPIEAVTPPISVPTEGEKKEDTKPEEKEE